MLSLQRIPHVQSPLHMLRYHEGIDQATYELVMLAFKHKGWVAGGFARRLLRDLLIRPVLPDDVIVGDLEPWNHEIAMRIRSYLGDRVISKNQLMNNQGDIDLFFESDLALLDFKTEYAHLAWSGDNAPFKKAWVINVAVPHVYTEIVVNEKTRVQIVENYVGSIDDILNGFDIYNAAVAFNDQVFVVPEGWEELERAEMLHVFNYTSSMVINRVAKWYWKHNFRKLSPATAGCLGTIALDVLEQLQDRPHEFSTGGLLQASVVKEKLQHLLPMLNNEQLLLLSAVFPLDSRETYSSQPPGVLSILRQRIGST